MWNNMTENKYPVADDSANISLLVQLEPETCQTIY